MSQQELADKAAVSKAAISQFEKGKNDPAHETLKAIVKGLGTNLARFFASVPKAKAP